MIVAITVRFYNKGGANVKKKIAWITDSTAYLSEELRQHPDVYVVPLVIMFGDETYEDGVTINEQQIYEKMKQHNAVPTTSQPSVGKFAQLYEQLKDTYEHFIILHISQKLSGTYSASKQGADIAGISYDLIDTRVTTAGMTHLLEEGLHMEQQGKTSAEIVSRLEELVPALENYILIGNLAQLHRGGRLSNAQFVLGTLLNIKPILQIHDGIVDIFEKVRSEKKATKLIMEKCREAFAKHDITRLAVIHGNREEDALRWKEMLLEMHPHLRVDVVPITSTLSVHAGEGTLAVMWYNAHLHG